MAMKVHHSFSDGLGLATLFMCLSDSYDAKMLPSMRPIGFIKNFLIHLISPVLTIQTILETGGMGRDKNCINNGKPISGVKTGGFSYDLNIAEIKAYCKAK